VSTNLTPALFMHIQKTAGTSIVNIARHYYGGSLVSHGDHLKRPFSELNNTLFVSGHFGYDFAKPLMPGRYSFTFLRDPVERILSFYYFCRSRNPDELPIYKKAQQLDLKSFLQQASENELIKSRIWNSQAWRLASGPVGESRVDDSAPGEILELAIQHLDMFSYIGFTDTFNEDIQIILTALRLPVLKEPVWDNATGGQSKLTDLNSEVCALLDELTVLDRALYDAALLRRMQF